MSYFVIENFGHGLDARRHILNLPPGTLYRAKNCNINRGGEPEICKAFVGFINLPAGQTFGLMAAGGKLWTFGSAAGVVVPDGIFYQQLIHKHGGGAMTGFVYGTQVRGKPFVIASFANGYGVFFNGLYIEDWKPPAGTLTTMRRSDHTIGPYAALSDIATNFAGQIQASTIYTATAAGNVVTITGRPGIPFTISAGAANVAGGVNDQTATVATTQVSDPGGAAVGAFTDLTFSGVQPDWNDSINMGAGGYVPTTACFSIKINGVEVCPGGVVAMDDASAAYGVANVINGGVTVPDYEATATGGPTVRIKAKDTGIAANGFAVVVDNGTPWHAANPAPMNGGSSGGATKSQISTVTFGGTYEVGDAYSITLNTVPYTMAASVPPDGGDTGDGGGGGTGGVPSSASGKRPVAALVKNSKTYAIADSNLFGSKIGDCTEWDADPDPSKTNGSFITDMSSEVAGADVLTALAIFQGNLAVFSRSTVQIRFVDPDPANNELIQVMQNIGTMSAKSVVPFGDSDVFFLSDTGVRSLKTRSTTNNATVADIGSPIDPLIILALRAVGQGAVNACAAMEPVDGRFLLQIGLTTYVFNFFPDAKVGGWTTWEQGLAITDFAAVDTRLFARAGDVIYLLGGPYYDTYSAQPPDIKLPFLSARQLATLKHFTALDVVCDGVWNVTIATDPLAPGNEEAIATLNGTSLGLGSAPFGGEDCTAISLRFVGRPSKYARLSSVAVHHEVIGENAP